MGKRNITTFFGIALFALAAYTTLSLILHIAGFGGIAGFLDFPGGFLYQHFLYSGFYVGLYLYFLGYLSISNGFNRRSILFLLYTLIPFVTASLLFHVILTDPPNAAAAAVILGFGGRRIGGLMLLALLVMELILGYRIILTPSLAEAVEGDEPEQEDDVPAAALQGGLFPLRQHVDMGDPLEVEELSPLQDEDSLSRENALRLDRDERGKLRAVPDGAGSVSGADKFADEDLVVSFGDEEVIPEDIIVEREESDLKEEIEEPVDESVAEPLSELPEVSEVPETEDDDLVEEIDPVNDFDSADDLESVDSPEELPARNERLLPRTPSAGRQKQPGGSGDTENRALVPEGEPGQYDRLYVNDHDDPSIRSMVKDLLDAEVSEAVSFAPSEAEAAPVIENFADDLEDRDLLDEPEDLAPVEDDFSFEEDLDLEEVAIDEDDLLDATPHGISAGVYEEEIVEDQLALLEERYGSDFEDDFNSPLPISPDEADSEDELPPLLDEEELEEMDDLETIEEPEVEEPELEEFQEDSLQIHEPVAPKEPSVVRLEDQKEAKKSAGKKKRQKYSVPVDELLDRYEDNKYWVVDDDTRHAGEVLRQTLEEFKIEAEVTGIRKGPVITMFEILPAPGVKLSKITNLADNIALRLAASSVRIVAPIPGKHAVGIEVPNHKRAIVSFHEMISDIKFDQKDYQVPVVLGKDVGGESQVVDLVNTPHMLIAGATGSGKSVCVNSLICSILCRKKPEEVRLLLIDPKIVELKLYNDIPHLLTPVITEPKKAFQALQYCLSEMEQRYALLDSQGVRDIRSYNRKVKERKLATRTLPYLVIIVDEFADLMATTGKELESTLARLAAMSRAVGIHLVLATQRPSIDVITGLIKANIPSRIAFMVAGKTDSRIIIDAVGAEKLLGKGDMLFTSSWDPDPSRIQGAFLSEDEVGRVVDHVKTLGEPDYIDDEIFFDEDEDSGGMFEEGGEDPLMDKALEIVTQAGKASASYLQRRLKIGYNRAARLVETMEHRGIVGPQNGSKPREILHIPNVLKSRWRSEDADP